jgi:hypothetical protein
VALEKGGTGAGGCFSDALVPWTWKCESARGVRVEREEERTRLSFVLIEIRMKVVIL